MVDVLFDDGVATGAGFVAFGTGGDGGAASELAAFVEVDHLLAEVDDDAGFAGHVVGISEGSVIAHEAFDFGSQEAGGAGDIISEDLFAVAEGGVAGGLDLDGGTTGEERDRAGCQQDERRREGAMIH